MLVKITNLLLNYIVLANSSHKVTANTNDSFFNSINLIFKFTNNTSGFFVNSMLEITFGF